MNQLSMSARGGSAMGGKKLFILTCLLFLFSGCSFINTNTNTPAVNVAPAIPTSKKLDLSNQNLIKVPEYVFKMSTLEELNISNNILTGAIQSQIGQLKKLKVLNASNNQMTGVPAEVGQLINLQVLDLSNNQLTGLPNELGNLKNLTTFNILGNDYSKQDLNGIMQKLPASVKIIK